MKCKLLISTIQRHRLLTNDLVFYSWTASVNDDVPSLWQQTRSSKCRHWGAGLVRTGEQSLDFLHSNYIHPVFTLFELFFLCCGSCSSSPAVLNKLHTTLGWDVPEKRRGVLAIGVNGCPRKNLILEECFSLEWQP